jgi:hypothetical protein
MQHQLRPHSDYPTKGICWPVWPWITRYEHCLIHVSMYRYHECKENRGDMTDALLIRLHTVAWLMHENQLSISNCQNSTHISSSCTCSCVQILPWLNLCKLLLLENGASSNYCTQIIKLVEEGGNTWSSLFY